MKKDVLLDIPLDDNPGTLHPIVHIFAENKVNIIAIMVFSRGALTVVDYPDKAAEALRKHGIEFSKEEVIIGEVSNIPGAFDKIIEKISTHRINIDFAYATNQPDSKKTLCVISTSDNEKALQIM